MQSIANRISLGFLLILGLTLALTGCSKSRMHRPQSVSVFDGRLRGMNRVVA